MLDRDGGRPIVVIDVATGVFGLVVIFLALMLY